MMEKYGLKREEYEVVKNGEVIDDYLTVDQASELVKHNKGAVMRLMK